jgi:hypothetical protein
MTLAILAGIPGGIAALSCFNPEDTQHVSQIAMNRLAPDGEEIEHQFRSHAPLDRFDPTRTNVSPSIRKSISEITAIEAIVLTVDIRRSSSVLKESIDIPQYARILDDFVAEFRTVLHYHGGWFDKFTGDGQGRADVLLQRSRTSGTGQRVK